MSLSMDAGAYLARRAELREELASIDAELRRIADAIEAEVPGRAVAVVRPASDKKAGQKSYRERLKAEHKCFRCRSTVELHANGKPFSMCRPCLDKWNAQQKQAYRARHQPDVAA